MRKSAENELGHNLRKSASKEDGQATTGEYTEGR